MQDRIPWPGRSCPGNYGNALPEPRPPRAVAVTSFPSPVAKAAGGCLAGTPLPGSRGSGYREVAPWPKDEAPGQHHSTRCPVIARPG